MKKIISILFLTLSVSFFIPLVFAQGDGFSQLSAPTEEVKLEGVVLEERDKIEVTSENRRGEILTIEQSFNSPNSPNPKTGDKMKVSIFKNPDGTEQIIITDFIRTNSIYFLFAIFIALVLLVGKKSGLGALVGMAVSFAVLFWFIIPRVTGGQNPVWITLVGVLFILPITFYLSHGFNRKTTVALVATFLSVCFTSLIALFFISVGKISGYANEQASFIQVARGGSFDIQGLLFAGIVISVLGILDDVTVSQSSIVNQLRLELPKAKVIDIYKKAMQVGKDHIGSVVNTLVLVYTGASLPLLILFTDNNIGFNEALNYEIIAEEIIKTLVASIGLILSIPLTTLMAAYYLKKEDGDH